jgi:hypothetical protein
MKNGFRLHGLLILGVTFMAYGLGLIFGYIPSISRILYVTPAEIGWAFLLVGSIMFVSLVSDFDQALYAMAALISSAWATIITILAVGTNGWDSSVAWWCLAVLCILLAGRSDPPEPLNLPPPPEEKPP